LRDLAAMARSQNLRLSFHPSQYINLNSVDAKLTAQSVHDIKSQAEMPDCMELGPEAVVVVHVGGTYGDRIASSANAGRAVSRRSCRNALAAGSFLGTTTFRAARLTCSSFIGFAGCD
jgi:UV DNA damage repair endonuclease